MEPTSASREYTSTRMCYTPLSLTRSLMQDDHRNPGYSCTVQKDLCDRSSAPASSVPSRVVASERVSKICRSCSRGAARLVGV